MGTIYAVGEEAEDASLAGKLRSATWPDGSPGVHTAYGVRLVVVLRLVPAMRRHCCGHPAGNQQLEMAHIFMDLHDGVGVHGSVTR